MVRHLGDVDDEVGRCRAGRTRVPRSLVDLSRPPKNGFAHLANAVLRSLAVLKEETGETEEARRLWQEARGLDVEVDVEPGVAECEAGRLDRLA